MTANPFRTPAQILEGVSAIALQIQQAVALENSLQIALDATQELLQTDRVLLYRFLSHGDGIVVAESAGGECTPLLGQLLDAPYLAAPWIEHYRQGYTNAIEDLTAISSAACDTDRLPRLEKRATLVVPLLIQGKLWGLLMAHHCQSARAWQPLEVQCLQMVAMQLGVAIQLETRSQEQLVGAIVAKLPGAIYRAVYSPQGSLSSLFLSDSYRTLLGYEPQVLMAHPEQVLELIHPDDRAHFFEALKAASETLKPNEADYLDYQLDYQLEYRLITASGEALWVKDTARFSRGEHGELIVDGMHLDISDRKRSEDALRQSEARKSALISALPDLIMRVDHNGYYLEFLATTTFKVVGKSGDFVGTSVYDSLPFDLAQRRMDAIRTALQTRSIQFYEQALLVDGQFQTEEVRVVPYQVDEVLLVVRDITARKQAEMALWQRAEREQAISRVVQTIRQSLDLQTILTAAATEIGQLLQVDQAAIVQYVPERQCWLHLTAYRREPAIPDSQGLEIPDAENPFAAQLKRQEVVKVVDTSAISDSVNQKLVRSAPGAWLLVPVIVGDAVWGSFSLYTSQKHLWQDEQIDVVQSSADQLAIAIQQAALYQQVQTLNTDLERQVQERTAQLHRALNFEALLKRITDHVRDSLDETQILQTAVQELAIELGVDCCDATLYDMERRTSTICYEHIQEQVSIGTGIIIPFDRNPDLYNQVLRRQVVHCCVTSLVVADSCRNIKQTSTILVCPLMDESGVLGDMWLFKPQQAYFEELEIRLVQQIANQCAIALRQSRLYQAAQAQVKELERLNQLKDNFLSTVSHELRTPMSNIKMATQMLEISLQPLGIFDNEASPVHRYFNILREEGQREIGLINDILDLARLDAGSEPLIFTTIALPPFLAHLAEPFLERTRKQQQQLIMHLPETLPALTTDRVYLERVLTELLQNACKYTAAGETITLAAHVTATALEICVSNSGVVIPAIECDRIFDKFYRIPNNDPWKHGGTGLGLTLVQKLTECLGATIRVTSGDNQTTFTLEFLGVV